MRPGLFSRPAPARPLAGQPLCTLAIDAEEDFDWLQPWAGTPYDTRCMQDLGQLQTIAAAYKLKPLYLLTYPVLQDGDAVRELRRYVDRGECLVSVQLHGWVTPPLRGSTDDRTSFVGNLPPAVEEEKLVHLIAAFRARFGERPRVFRSGRYGLGASTPQLLERHGFDVDVSVAPRTQFTIQGGPDFSAMDCTPFWFGETRRVLEVPLCRSVVGWGGRLARDIYLAGDAGDRGRPAAWRRSVLSLLGGLRAAERVTLSPEGNDLPAMRRLVRRLLARGERVLTVSFHSSSLRPGRSPYVRTARDLHLFYDRLSALLHFLADDAGCRFTDLSALPGLLADPLAVNEAALG
jgi:hypothetical protein